MRNPTTGTSWLMLLGCFKPQNNHTENDNFLSVKDYFPWGFLVPSSQTIFLLSYSFLLSYLPLPASFFNSVVSCPLFSLYDFLLSPCTWPFSKKKRTYLHYLCVCPQTDICLGLDSLMPLLKFILTHKKGNAYSSKAVTNMQGKIKYSLKVFLREPPSAHLFTTELGHQWIGNILIPVTMAKKPQTPWHFWE